MERDEEIIRASVDYNADKGKLHVIGGDAILSDEEFIAFNQNASFINGAKWADEHPRKGLVDIEKACEWLRTHSEMDFFELIPVANYCGAGNFNKKKMIEDFKKYMEGKI